MAGMQTILRISVFSYRRSRLLFEQMTALVLRKLRQSLTFSLILYDFSQKIEAKNMQNLAQFWTTSAFDGEYLRNYNHSSQVVL